MLVGRAGLVGDGGMACWGAKPDQERAWLAASLPLGVSLPSLFFKDLRPIVRSLKIPSNESPPGAKPEGKEKGQGSAGVCPQLPLKWEKGAKRSESRRSLWGGPGPALYLLYDLGQVNL